MNNTEKALKEKDKSESGQIIGQYVNHYLSNNPIPGIQHRYNFLKEVLDGISLKEINEVAKKMPYSTAKEAVFELRSAINSRDAFEYYNRLEAVKDGFYFDNLYFFSARLKHHTDKSNFLSNDDHSSAGPV